LLATLVGVAVVLAIAGCNRESVSARLAAEATYRAENGEEITVKYYRLDDDSLAFVILELPGGETQTLPQLVSASGARYTDERDYQWWIKGDTARLEVRDESGNWTTRYTCTVE
jgi:membrane-bound inhibitor of C-type lysozyme